MEFNDIRDDLDTQVDAKGDFELRKLQVGDKEKKNTNDILESGEDIDISGSKHIKIHKNRTKNFDSFVSNKKLKDIHLNQKKGYFFGRILGKKEGKIELSGIKNRHLLLLEFKKDIFINKYTKALLFLFAFIFFAKVSVEYFVHSGYNRIVSLKEQTFLIDDIQREVNNARFDFIVSDLLFSPFLVIPNQNIENVYHVIKGGKVITGVADNIIQYIYGLQDFITEKGLENIYITNLLENSKEDLLMTENGLEAALLHYDQIQNIGNTDLENKLSKAVVILKKSLQYIHTINAQFETFLSLLGHNEERKYLIVFQNNDEIRPTGGFMGSMGILSLYRGKIQNFEKTDVYAYEWEINKVYTDKIPAPKGLNQITGTFGLRDANYYIGYDSSAQQIKFFLDKINADIDGVVFVNQNVIKDLLDVTGPIDFEMIEESIESNNFSLILSTLVEAKTFKTGLLGTPKQILFDFSQEFFRELASQKKYTDYLSVILKHVASRDIVVYSYIPEENSLLWKLGLTGKIQYNSTLDFSYPVFTSLSGNKSDRYMKRSFEKNVVVNDDCSIDTTFDIISSHHFTAGEEDKVNQLMDKFHISNRNHIQYIQGRGDNYQYLRLLLPKDAFVLDNENYSIQKYDHFQILETYVKTRRLETTHLNIAYRIDNPNCKAYDYSFYKQPGIEKYNFSFTGNGDSINVEDISSDFIYKKTQ